MLNVDFRDIFSLILKIIFNGLYMHRNLCTFTVSVKYSRKIMFRAYLTRIALSKMEFKWLLEVVRYYDAL